MLKIKVIRISLFICSLFFVSFSLTAKEASVIVPKTTATLIDFSKALPKSTEEFIALNKLSVKHTAFEPHSLLKFKHERGERKTVLTSQFKIYTC